MMLPPAQATLYLRVTPALFASLLLVGPAMRPEHEGVRSVTIEPAPAAIAFRDSPGITLESSFRAVPEGMPVVVGGVIFDDFRYAEPVDYSNANKSGSPNTIFGPNRWLEGLDLDHLRPGAEPTRAWYGFGWQDEYIAYPHIACPTPPCSDTSLFDGNGAELYTEPVSAAPGHAVLQYRAGAYSTNRLVGLLLTSGFAARTGTWVARVRLPDFNGLDLGNGGVGVLLAPLWLKNSTEAWETRATWLENTGGTNWWEANIEMWRESSGWRRYADGHYHPEGLPDAERYLSAGNSWYRYSSAVYEDTEGDLRAAHATFGPCAVVHRAATAPYGLQTSTLGQRECLDAMIGRPEEPVFEGLGHPYVYVMYRHTGQQTRRYLYVRREDDRGNPVTSPGFESLLLDQEQFNYVDPGYFSAQLEMLLYPTNVSIPTGTIERRNLEMQLDWFLYTPDTGLTIQQAPALAGTVRAALTEYNEGLSASQQLWRANTTGLALEAPWRAKDPWATCNPWRIEPTANWDFVIEKTDRGGQTYFTVHLVRDDDHDLRKMYQSIAWRVVRGGRVVESVRNQGYTLLRGAHWGTDAPFNITATVTQTSPVTHPPFEWHHNSATECPDSFGSATRTHTYLYDPVRGLFRE